MRCPACSWLVERRLERAPGVACVAVNPATARARLEWRSGGATLSPLLRAIHALGYRPHVLGAADTLEVAVRERRTALKRLVVAGFGMMQVMMFAVPLYIGESSGMDAGIREFLCRGRVRVGFRHLVGIRGTRGAVVVAVGSRCTTAR